MSGYFNSPHNFAVPQLSVSEPTGSVSRYVGREMSSLTCLRMPVANCLPSLSLNEALAAEADSRVNLLVGVKVCAFLVAWNLSLSLLLYLSFRTVVLFFLYLQSVSAPRSIETKFGPRMTSTVRVMDETCHDFSIKTWNEEEIRWFQRWQPRSIVHFQVWIRKAVFVYPFTVVPIYLSTNLSYRCINLAIYPYPCSGICYFPFTYISICNSKEKLGDMRMLE